MGEYLHFKKPEFTEDERIRRVWDIEEIKKCAHKRAFFNANNQREEELAACWVSEPENMKTASYGSNWGYYVGMDEIRRYYIDGNKTAKYGASRIHPMSTWAVELAFDGKTAQGVWYSMSQETFGSEDGTSAEAYWLGEKIGIDFIKEADGWKIWHYFTGIDYFCAPGDKLCDQPCFIEPVEQAVNPMQAEFGEPTIEMLAYDNKYNWSHYPPLPTPHKTYAETINCGPTGNPNYNSQEVNK